MTDEERTRQALLDKLLNVFQICEDAADEIERLAALAQSNAEPVAWQYRNEISKAIAIGISDNKHPISIADDVLALLTAQPRLDASALRKENDDTVLGAENDG